MFTLSSRIRFAPTCLTPFVLGVPCGAQTVPALIPALSHPPIPVSFVVPKPGFVTLVIEDMSGKRHRACS